MSGAFFNDIEFIMIKDIILAVCLLIILLLIWVVIFDISRFTISRYRYKSNKIKKPFRAVVISDLHNKQYGQGNIKLLEAVREEHPDIIIIAGDIMNAHPQAGLDVAFDFLEKISKDYPVYYGNGNHETRMRIYAENYGDRYEVFENKLKELGIHHLTNLRESIDEYGIDIIGCELDRRHYKRRKPEPIDENELVDMMGKVDGNKYTVLIAHNPDYFKDYSEYGADLILSGHVHGGIVRIPFIKKGVLSPRIMLFPRYSGGEYRDGEATMVVSRGLGVHTIPVRMFNPGDLVVIDFET